MRQNFVSRAGILLFLLIFWVLGAQDAGAAPKKYISFGTGNPGGTFYFLGAGFASVINKYVPEVRVVAESTAASEENFNLLLRKRMDLGLASNIPVQSAVEKKVNLSPIRLMAMGSTSDIHWIVRKESPIKSIADFRGHRVAVGAPGSGTLAATKWKLEAFGITFNDIKPAYLSYSESITAVKDNTVDVGQITAGYPVASLLDLARYTPIRLISLSQEELKITLAKIPYYVEVTIPADVYPGITTAIATLGSPAALFCREDLSEDLVYKLMRAIYEHPKEIGAIHPQAVKWNLENAFRGAEFATRHVSFHKGAVKYFQEKGIWKELN